MGFGANGDKVSVEDEGNALRLPCSDRGPSWQILNIVELGSLNTRSMLANYVSKLF